MSTIDKTKKVLVTGGSGYLASWIIKKILDKGINVHATVRDPEDRKKTAHLKALDNNGLLKLFKADLLDMGSFKESMQGCDIVIHTASPFFISGFKDAQLELITPARQGTINVLEQAKLTPSIKRVVLTSSVVATYGDNMDAKNKANFILTENDWNETSSVDHMPYSFSKTIAEKKAWEISKTQDQWDLVVINPGLIFGPSLSKREDSFSIKTMCEFGKGHYRTGVPDTALGVVDVRDVATAHINAAFIPKAKGRHILVSKTITFMDIADIIRKKIPGKYPLPKMIVPKFVFWLIAPFLGFTRKYVSRNVGHLIEFDNSYSIDNLKMSFRPIEETITDHFQQVVDDGLINKK